MFPVVLFWLQIQPTWIRFVSSGPQETMLLLCQGFKNCLAPEPQASHEQHILAFVLVPFVCCLSTAGFSQEWLPC